jgi:hypothetical protein
MAVAFVLERLGEARIAHDSDVAREIVSSNDWQKLGADAPSSARGHELEAGEIAACRRESGPAAS